MQKVNLSQTFPKMDAMTQSLEYLNVNAINTCVPFPPCDSCASFDRVTLGCQIGSLFPHSSSDPVAYVNDFPRRLNHNLYLNAYNPSWKNYPHLSYRSDLLPFPQPNTRPSPSGLKDLAFLHMLHKSPTQRLYWIVCFWHIKNKASVLSNSHLRLIYLQLVIRCRNPKLPNKLALPQHLAVDFPVSLTLIIGSIAILLS